MFCGEAGTLTRALSHPPGTRPAAGVLGPLDSPVLPPSPDCCPESSDTWTTSPARALAAGNRLLRSPRPLRVLLGVGVVAAAGPWRGGSTAVWMLGKCRPVGAGTWARASGGRLSLEF